MIKRESGQVEASWRRRFRAPTVSFPNWAPRNPQHLLYTSNLVGKSELYEWDMQTGRHRQVTDRPDGTAFGFLDPRGDWIWWFDDDHGNEFGRWRRQRFGSDSDEPATDLQAAYQAGLALGDELAVVGLSGDRGTTFNLVRQGQASAPMYEHPEHASVEGLSRDEKLISMAHSEHGDSRHPALRVLDLRGGIVGELRGEPGRGLDAGPWSPLAGDQRLIVLHERTGLKRPAIWAPFRATLSELAIDLPGEVSASWYPDARALLLTHEWQARSELYRLELEPRRLHRLNHPKGTIASAQVRPNGEVWYDWSSAAHPPEVRSEGRVVLRPPGDPAPAGVAFQDLWVNGIHVFLAEPSAARPHPTVVGVHGGPPSYSGDEFLPRTLAWVDHGFAVLNVNYRGSTSYGQAWRDAIEGNPGFTELADIAAVRAYAVDNGIADPHRIILTGGSWGGYLTLLGLGTQPDLWSLGIAEKPTADYIAAFEDMMEPEKAFDRALFGGSPADRPEFYAERSPITYAERLMAPVQILAGQNDPRCPIRQIHNYLARLKKLGKAVEYWEFDAGHFVQVVDDSIRQMELKVAFASKHLGTQSPM